MKIMNWNIEWMNDWFTPISAGPAAWRVENAAKGITDVRALAARVASVITAVAPDVLAVQEGPSRAAAMQLFVDDHLDGAFTVLGPTGTSAQRLYVLVRKDGAVDQARRVFPVPGMIDYAQSWPVDVVGDLVIESYEFTRQPLEVELTVGGRQVLLVNLHSKSKYIHGGQSLWDNEATRPQFIAQAVRNRRRIAAELMRVRTALDERMQADPEARIIVVGDLNDGPGVDFFEERYLIHNVVAVVSGNPFDPRRILRHAFIDRELKERNWTARFDDFIDEIRDRPLLLDHILLAPSVYWGPFRNARIEHEAFEARIDRAAGGRMHAPSDHRPQSVTLEFG
jgi:endonuclease/exonuclease/phosphatase family metal-dependent hydrolase